MTFVMIVAGLALLLGGGDALVRGSVALAVRLGVPSLVIGVTLVGFGTSLPELVASLQAALRGSPGIALGNIVGSNIANILLILGLAAVILPIAGMPVRRRDMATLALATGALTVAILFGTLTRSVGALFVAGLIGYTALCFLRGGSDDEGAEEPLPGTGLKIAPAIALAVIGIGGVLFGAHLLVDGAINVAARLGVPEAVIGLTIVALGTSLPELATTLAAAVRREPGVVLGNIIGSNIFNVLAIAGITALVQPLAVPEPIANFDVWVMVAATFVMVAATLTRGVGRVLGALLFVCYAAYFTFEFVM